MNSQSHLYEGFRFAGALESVAEQRTAQAHILSNCTCTSVLVVGGGFGEETDVLMSAINKAGNPPNLTVIDLADVSAELRSQPFLRQLGPRLRFSQIDLLDAPDLPGYGGFDLVQCGFVLHDFAPCTKDAAVATLAGSVRPGGHVLISDICVRLSAGTEEVDGVYSRFLEEAWSALNEGRLTEGGYSALVGDGIREGLERSRRDAFLGERDHFEDCHDVVRRALRAGLELVRVNRNSVNERLFVFLFRRPVSATNGISAATRSHVVLRGMHVF